ncbi:MAG: hypothetical protein LV473_22610 [Nitrospira sp.]|nr:hypothetical protein [Nitrospira sp.]
MQPGKEALDESAALIPSVVAVILGLEYAGEPMRRNEIHAVLFEIVNRGHRCQRSIPSETPFRQARLR